MSVLEMGKGWAELCLFLMLLTYICLRLALIVFVLLQEMNLHLKLH